MPRKKKEVKKNNKKQSRSKRNKRLDIPMVEVAEWNGIALAGYLVTDPEENGPVVYARLSFGMKDADGDWDNGFISIKTFSDEVKETLLDCEKGDRIWVSGQFWQDVFTPKRKRGSKKKEQERRFDYIKVWEIKVLEQADNDDTDDDDDDDWDDDDD